MKSYTPFNPSMRHLLQIERGDLSKKRKRKVSSLFERLPKSAGRNHQGHITVRRRGGGHLKLYRQVDFLKKPSSPLSQETFEVQDLQYDPNRTSFIALIRSLSCHQYRYMIAPQELNKGDQVTFANLDADASQVKIHTGCCLPLRWIPVGTFVYDLELRPGKGAQLVRSAGAHALMIQKGYQLKENGPTYCQLRLPSGEIRIVLDQCLASVGTVSNPDHQNRSLGKAGRNRWLGKRPRVRGVAMNPVDHPHGGGEGKTSGGRPSVTPKGLITKGKPTRSKKKSTKFILSKASTLSSFL